MINDWDQKTVQLYHLKTDPHEKQEVSEQNPEIVERLRKEIEAWHPVKR